MTAQMIIVLILLLFLVIMLLTHILPYGLSAMICCICFVLFGIADIPTAMGGLSNSTTVMVACMMAIAVALGKTGIVHKLRSTLGQLKGKSKLILVAAMCLVTIALSQLMSQTPVMSIMLLFCITLDDEDDVSPARMLFVCAVVNTLWTSRIPVGMGATFPGMVTSFYQGMVSEADYLSITDYMKAGTLPALVAVIYCILRSESHA